MQFAPGILSAINSAASQYGVSPEALQRIAWLESRGNPAAKNPKSSAGGLFQFIDSTAGQYGLQDRYDPAQAADAGARLARDNAAHLRRVLGRDPTPGELYLAHQQGAGGATKLLSNPTARAADLVGADAVALNGGRPDMTAAEFAGLWLSKAGDVQPEGQPASQPQTNGGPQMNGILGAIGMGEYKPKTHANLIEAVRQGGQDGRLWDAIQTFTNLAQGKDNSAVDDRVQARESEGRLNQTAEWLRANGRGDLADALVGGMIDGPTAFSAMQPAPVEYGWQTMPDGSLVRTDNTGGATKVGEYGKPEGEEKTAAMQNYEYMIANGVPGDVAFERAFGGNGTSVTVNNGGEVGTIPQGFELFTDPETGARSMRPIAGGPEDKTKQEQAKANAAETSGDTIITAATRARDAARERAFGPLGQGTVSKLNPLSDAAEVGRQVAVLKANATIEALNAMRQQSPTGGALGNVTEGEGQMLAAKSGALDPSSPTFERDLADYTQTLLRVIHGRDQGDRIFGEQWGAPEAQSGPGDLSDDDLLKQYGG